MLSIKHIPSENYIEASQPLLMKWCVLDVSNKDNVVGQHGWWQCKDFLNDCVYYLRTGITGEVYNFVNVLKLNEGLSYVALRGVRLGFTHNLRRLNVWLKARGWPQIGLVGDHDKGCSVQHVITIPEFYWNNTLYISFITSLIRSCCYGKYTGEDITEMFKRESTLTNFFNNVLLLLDKVDVGVLDKLIFCNYHYNHTTNFPGMYYVHDAGLQKWVNSYGNI